MCKEIGKVRKQLEQRLEELGNEFEAGQKAMAELEAKLANFRQTLLRISGAIQVLEEELDKVAEPDSKGTDRPKGARKNVN